MDIDSEFTSNKNNAGTAEVSTSPSETSTTVDQRATTRTRETTSGSGADREGTSDTGGQADKSEISANENPQVFNLPRFEAQSPVALSQRYPYVCVLGLSILLAIVVAIFTAVFLLAPQADFGVVKPYLPWVGIPVVWMYATVWLSAKCKAYAVRPLDVSFYSGILFKRVVVQPITRLQHIEVSRGALERAFGLATLKLFSAGGAMHSVAIPGLIAEDAEALRGHILNSRGLENEQ